MRRLSSLGSKSLAHRKGRSALTGLGICLGVAVFFGVLVSNATTQAGVDRMIESFTGRADVVVDPAGAFSATLPPDLVDDVAALPDVEHAVEALGVPAGVDVPGEGEELGISVRGTHIDRAQAVQDHDLVTGRFPRSGTTEIVVPEALAARLEVGIGDSLGLRTPTGPVEAVVTGIMADAGAGRTNQGNVAYTTLPTAQHLGGQPDAISGIAVVLADGVDADAWIDLHAETLGPEVSVQNAALLASGFRDFLGILGTFFTFFAAITLFVAAFLIYLSLSMSVVERTKLYGTMRALGATRGQVSRLVLAESAILGAVATAVGLGFGLLLALGLNRMMAMIFDLDFTGLVVDTPAVVAAVVVGLTTTVVSAVLPARRAGRLAPVVAMRGEYGAGMRLGRTWMVGVAALIAGTAIALAGGSDPTLGGLGTLVILLGAVLVVPLVLGPLAGVLGRLTARLARGVGDVAVLHLVKERSRSAYTLALIMVVMAMLFAIGGLRGSVLVAFEETLDRQFGADIRIQTRGAVDEDITGEVAAVDGVDRVAAIRFGQAEVLDVPEQHREWFLVIVDPEVHFDVDSFFWVDGDDDDARDALRDGHALLLPQSMAEEFEVARGGSLRLDTTEGPREFEVAGTYVAFGGQLSLVVGLPDGRRYFNASRPNQLAVGVETGVEVEDVRRRLDDVIAGAYPVTVRTSESVKQEARSELGQYFNILYAILFVAATVGLLGLANTLAMSVLRRYREIGVLRAIGVTRTQVWRMVLVESATLGLVAFVLSLPLGWLLATTTVRATADAFGFTMATVYPAAWVPGVAALGIVVAVLAALAPGRRASRLQVVEALQYE